MGTHSWSTRALFALWVSCLAFAGGLPLASSASAQVAETGSIGGTVNDDAGNPLAGIAVGAQGGSTGWYEAVTDSNGQYQVTGLPDQEYVVSFEDPSGTYAAEYYDGTTDWNTATWLEVADGAALTGIDATLEPGGRITGSILDEEGAAFARTSICVVGTTSRCAEGATDGTYEVGGLATGDYYVAVETWEADGTLRSLWYDGVHGPTGSTLVPVTLGQVSGGIDFVFDRTLYGTLSGQVLDQDGNPIEDAYVCAEGPIAECDDLAADGTYQLGLLPGDYRVTFRGRIGDLHHIYDGTPGGADEYEEALLVTVTAGAANTGIDAVFDLSIYGSITGTILDDGSPYYMAWACVEGGPTWRCVDADPDGSYALDFLEAGEYLVYFGAARADQPEEIIEYYDGVGGPEDATPITVLPGQTVAGINARYDSGEPGEGWISGTTVFASGDPVTSGEVCAWPRGETYPSLCVEMDDDGSFVLGPLAPDVYRVGALFDFDDALADPMHEGEIHIPFDGETVTDVEIVFAPAGSVSGLVTGPGGAPVAGVAVGLFGPDDSWLPSYVAETRADGGYWIADVPRQDYRVVFLPADGSGLATTWHSSPDGSAARVEVRHGAHSVVSQRLVPVGSVSGSVTDPSGNPVAGVEVRLREPGSPWVSATAISGPDGSYSIAPVDPGAYQLRFVAPEGSSVSDIWYGDTLLRAEADVVQVVPGSSLTADATMPWSSALSGTVSGPGGTPVRGAVVRAYRTTDGIVPSGRIETAVDGSYSLPSVPRGEYRLHVTAPDGSGLVAGWVDGATRSTARLIVIDDEHVVADVELTAG